MPTVLFLPDSALLVPGSSGSSVDPLHPARLAALDVLRSAPVGGEVLVLAPGRVTRLLRGPFGDGLAAAGVRLGVTGDGLTAAGVRVGATGSSIADLAVPSVGAAAALTLLGAAGHDPAAATVLEIGSGDALPELDLAPGVLLVVGSLSARHGPDAPLPDDPAAIAADVALLTALDAGPGALAAVLADLGPAECERLAITGAGPWRVLLTLLGADATRSDRPDSASSGDGTRSDRPAPFLPDAVAELLWSGTPGGAQHAVARWRIEVGG